jgi:hypothetical protein
MSLCKNLSLSPKHKLIKDIGDIKTGISYTNETKSLMNNKIHKKIYGHNNFVIG